MIRMAGTAGWLHDFRFLRRPSPSGFLDATARPGHSHLSHVGHPTNSVAWSRAIGKDRGHRGGIGGHRDQASCPHALSRCHNDVRLAVELGHTGCGSPKGFRFATRRQPRSARLTGAYAAMAAYQSSLSDPIREFHVAPSPVVIVRGRYHPSGEALEQPGRLSISLRDFRRFGPRLGRARAVAGEGCPIHQSIAKKAEGTAPCRDATTSTRSS